MFLRIPTAHETYAAMLLDKAAKDYACSVVLEGEWNCCEWMLDERNEASFSPNRQRASNIVQKDIVTSTKTLQELFDL